MPFGENTSGRATAFCRSGKTRLGGQRHFAIRGKRAGASNGVSPFEENAFGRRKPFWVEVAFALGKHHPFGFSSKSRNFRKNTAWTCQKTVRRNILLYCFPILHFLLYFSYDFRRLTQNHIRARHPAEGHLQGTGAFPKLHERAFEWKKGILIGFAGETVRFFASRYKTC